MFSSLHTCSFSVGNRHFRQLVASQIRSYLFAKTKADKGFVIQSIMDIIKSQGGTFVRPDPRSLGWWVVDDATAREKVGSNIRAIVKAMGGEAAVIAKLKCMEKEQNIDGLSQNKSYDLPYGKRGETVFDSPSSEEDPIDESGRIDQHDDPIESIGQENFFFREGGFAAENGSLLMCNPDPVSSVLCHPDPVSSLLCHPDANDEGMFDWIPPNIVSDFHKEREPLPLPVSSNLSPALWQSSELRMSQDEMNRLLNWTDLETDSTV